MTQLSVASSREVAELAGTGADVETAVQRGLVARAKVRGRWVYMADGVSLDSALSAALGASEAYLEEWLIGRAPYFVGGVCKLTDSIRIGKGAMQVLIHELATAGRLRGLAILNADYQPFIAHYRRSDEDEIAAQLDALEAILERRGRASARDLRTPSRAVARKAWRDVILRHGEWLGWGAWLDGELVAWP